MFEPVIMSKQIFDALPKNHQDVIMGIGAEMEEFGTEEAIADDKNVAEVYGKKGAKVSISTMRSSTNGAPSPARLEGLR
jgi:TRAP-type C4-dicarboxylate transport system substrate-binding protein